MKFVGEAGLRLTNAGQNVERALKELSPHYRRLKHDGKDVILDLSEATARIRVNSDDIWVRVEATDLPLCQGTKMLIEGTLYALADDMDPEILWVEGREVPFAALRAHMIATADAASHPGSDNDRR